MRARTSNNLYFDRMRRLPLLILFLLIFASCTSRRGGGPLPEEFYQRSGGEPTSEIGDLKQLDFGDELADYGSPAASTNLYRLGVGDELNISIYGHEASIERVKVQMTGKISYPLFGAIEAANRTIPEIRRLLQKKVDEIYNYGIVTVTPHSFGSRSFTVLGEVNHPGVYSMTGNERVVDAICRANGLRTGYFRNSTMELSDLSHAAMIRDNRVLPVDFEALIKDGDTAQNILLADGDIIFIPSSMQRNVYVLGEVNFPRSVGFYGSLSLIQAVAEARGRTAAAGSEIIIVSGNLAKPTTRVVDYEKVLNGEELNVYLKPNDIVYIPRPKWEAVTDLAKLAIRTFIGSATAESSAQLYQKADPDSDISERPIVIQGGE